MKQMRRSLIALAASGILAAPLMAQAAGDPAAGKEKYASCAACHGADGMGQGGAFPKLTGLSEDEAAKKLTAYRDGDQEYLKSVGLGSRYGTMAPNASGLSDEDIANLAAYIADEFGGAGGGDAAAADQGGDKGGEKAASAGIAQADIARGSALYSSCAICHGEQGEGGHLFSAPALKGMAASQVASLLKVYRKGTEMGPKSYAMIPQATHLSDADINNLAAYVATIGTDEEVPPNVEGN
ncbi:c-type cytochrome [Guyparkeria hydrothermalis]|uniref:c-type cytochrome n=1 Tax=Guyparkeria hydrothermalis TaxID=923 RepID=UPI002021690C|nr:c-type cytochrome [Guyparkeria hydrothermalis]MCL7744495.1 c-type cytochrome [Guyparkeria hydrothermalis]